MKKLVSLMLSSVLVMNMNMTAFASEVSGGGVGDYNADVIGTYNAGGSGEAIYSVDISWSGLSFTYNAASKDWDTTNHKYIITEEGWAASDAKIIVVNHSNAAIQATPVWKSEDGYTEVTMSYTDENGEKITSLALNSAETTNTEQTGTINVTPGGILASTANASKIGQITISIQTAAVVNGNAVSSDKLTDVLTSQISSGITDISITLPANADDEMFEDIREVLLDDSTVKTLTIAGAISIPSGFLEEETSDDGIKSVNIESICLPDATEIGSEAFFACRNLTSVYAPKVQTVGSRAFSNSGITSIELPEATTIESVAFCACTELTSVKLPKATNIGQMAFGVCNALETLELTAEGDIVFGTNCFGVLTPSISEQVNLTLNSNKENSVSENGFNGFTFKSITYKE